MFYCEGFHKRACDKFHNAAALAMRMRIAKQHEIQSLSMRIAKEREKRL